MESEPRPAAPTAGRRPRWRVVFAAFAATAHGPGVHYIYGVFQAALLDAKALTTSRALLGGAGGLSTCLMLLSRAVWNQSPGIRRDVVPVTAPMAW